jgi:protoporphyrinogen oxidase
MHPYNVKVWATPATEMSSSWIAERVAVVDYDRALRNVREGLDDAAWGPNNTFVFPSRGGTGEIYSRIARGFPDRIKYRSEVVEILADRSRLRLDGGEELGYDEVVSTMPLDQLVAAVRDCPTALRSAATKLRHTGVFMVGVGYKAPLADDKSWMYFPQQTAPFYRATNFAKYAATNVPEADTRRYSAYMTETSYSEHKPEPRDGLEDRVEAGLRASGVVVGRPLVASVHVEQVEYAYPVPTLERDEALAMIQPWLGRKGIRSRGRFGSWRYELGNMDHAVKMGIDAARAIVTGGVESPASPGLS